MPFNPASLNNLRQFRPTSRSADGANNRAPLTEFLPIGQTAQESATETQMGANGHHFSGRGMGYSGPPPDLSDAEHAARIRAAAIGLVPEAIQTIAGIMRNPRVAAHTRLAASTKIAGTGMEILGLTGKQSQQSPQQPGIVDADFLAALSAAVERRKQAAQAVEAELVKHS